MPRDKKALTSRLEGLSDEMRDALGLAAVREVDRLRAIVELIRLDLSGCVPDVLRAGQTFVSRICGQHAQSANPKNRVTMLRLKRELKALQRPLTAMVISTCSRQKAHRKGVKASAEAPVGMHRDESEATTYYAGPVSLAISDESPALSIPLTVSVELLGPKVVLSGSARNLTILEAQRLLADPAIEHLRLCETCGVPFIRTRRQTHCNAKCRDSAYYRKWKITDRGEAARRRFYEKHGWRRGARRNSGSQA